MSRKPTLVAVGVLKVDDKLALIKFKRNVLTGYWGLPGGKIDADESVPEAVERELLEELGLHVQYRELLGVLDEEIKTKDDTQHFMMFVCSVKPLDTFNLKSIDHDEGTVDWFTKEEIEDKSIPIVPSDYQIITRVALGKEQGYFYSQLDMASKPPKLTTFNPQG